MRRKRTFNYLKRDFNKQREQDKITKTQRSDLMSKIRSNGTKFERDFIIALRKRTRCVFNINVKELRGKPDIVFDRAEVCVFLDSDFWHGWQYPRWEHLMKNQFWRDKIEANRKRDKRNTSWLRRQGWKVIRIWEHNINVNIDAQINTIITALKIKNR
jgi:DNA mismatch endonuclease (patch repair protein)